jgi:hypothetical protein
MLHAVNMNICRNAARGIVLTPYLVAFVVGALVIGFVYWKGYKAGGEAVKLEWAEASQKQKEREEAAIRAAVEALEKERKRKKVVYRDIVKTVEKIVERPVYRNQCMDDDGLRCVNAALRGESEAGCDLNPGVPGIKPLGREGWGLRHPQAGGGRTGLQRLPGQASPAG